MVVLGIDLGTRNVCVATPKEHSIGIVLNKEAKRINECILGFTADEGRLFGSAAKRRLRRNVRNTIYELIRLIGRRWTDSELKSESVWWGFKLVRDNSGKGVAVEVNHNNESHVLGPEQILAAYISHLKDLAIMDLGTRDVKDCCVAVPVYFTHVQRQLVANACAIAKMNLLKIVNQTTAVALMFGLNLKEADEQYTMFIDVGFANTQVSIVHYIPKESIMRVICQSSEPMAGGRDITRAMTLYFVKQIDSKYGTNIMDPANPNWKVINRLLDSCNKLKKLLSLNNEAKVVIDCLIKGDDYVISMEREKLHELLGPILKRMLRPVNTALHTFKTKMEEKETEVMMHCVELVGGGLRVPMIRKRIEERIEVAAKDIRSMKSCIVRKTLNGDESVSTGTAYLATILSKSYRVREATFFDLTNFDLSVVSAADPDNTEPLLSPAKPIEMVSKPIWGCASKIASTRVISLNASQVKQFIRTPQRPNNYLLIWQNLGERADFDEHSWICKISVAWEEIAKHKYSEIIQEHLKLEKEVLLMARVGSDEILGKFDAYCPILVDVLEAWDKKKREEAEAAKPKEPKPAQEEKKEENTASDGKEKEKLKDEEKKVDTDKKTDEEAAKAPKKKKNKKRKLALTVTAEFFKRSAIPLSIAIETENKFKRLDEKIAHIQNTRNQLETMIYDVRDKLDDQYKTVVDPKRLEEHRTTISAMMDKLDDEYEISKDAHVYTKDIDVIKSITRPLDQLLIEHNVRPQVVKTLQSQIQEYTKIAETAEYLDDEKKKKVLDKCGEVKDWLESKLAEQEKLPMWVKVAVKVSLIKQKLNELNVHCKPLCEKPPPPPPEKKEEEKKETEKKDTKAEAEGPTTKAADQAAASTTNAEENAGATTNSKDSAEVTKKFSESKTDTQAKA